MRWIAMSLLLAGCEASSVPGGDAGPATAKTAASARADAPAAKVAPSDEAEGAGSGDERSGAEDDGGGPAEPEPATLAFVGDVNLALEVGIHLGSLREGEEVPDEVEEGYPFTHVRERLVAADLLVGNLECVASPLGALATSHNPFRCAPGSIEVLLDAGFDLVSIANNHARDFGPVGMRDMMKRLEEGGLPYFGEETFTRELQEPVVHELAGLRVGLLAYYYPPETMRDVRAAQDDVDLLVAFMHWGQENQPEPMVMQRRLARKLIDAGTDAVVGTHAHVLQPTDEHDGKFIAYGLGNFVFSGMNHTEMHRRGAMLELEIHPDGRIEPEMVEIRLDAVGAPRFVEAP